MKKIFLILGLITLTNTIQVFAQSPEDNNKAKELFNEGEKKKRASNYKGAIVDYTKAVTTDPTFINAYLQRGWCFQMLEDYRSAIYDYSEVIKIKNDHIWAYLSRGSAHNKMKEYNLAIKDFNKVLQLDPNNTEALNNRGWAKKGLGNTKGACEDWNESKKKGNQEAKIILKNTKCK